MVKALFAPRRGVRPWPCNSCLWTGSSRSPASTPGFYSRLLMVAATGIGILVIAGVNFVNLLTARSARRAREVSVRKLAGAGRRVLLMQFLTESIVYVVAASLLAIALTELLLPYVNAFLTSGATFRYWQDPTLIASIALAVLLLGILAGGLSGLGPVGLPSPARSGGGDQPVAQCGDDAPDPGDGTVLNFNWTDHCRCRGVPAAPVRHPGRIAGRH